MSKLRANIAANMAGTGTQAMTQLACAPLYVKLLGIDAYGLIGFFLTLQASLRILDLGLSPTMNRQMARYSVQPEKSAEARDFVRTLEIIYWIVGIVVGAAICISAPAIATKWIKPGHLPIGEVQRSVVLMGLLVAVQWPLSLYQGGLMGLERQIQMNGIRSAAAIGAGGGAVLVLWLLSPTLVAFFVWQVIANLIYVVSMAIAMWGNLPQTTRRARFDMQSVRDVVTFAGGMSGMAVAGVTLTQMDKIILSKLLPLNLFGYYTLAALVANSLQLFIGPLFNAIFPRLSALTARKDDVQIRRVYHEGTQLMAVLVLPLALTLICFAPEVLGLWTGNPVLAMHGSPIVVFLVAGTAINGIMFLPYALQLANGWTSLGLIVSICMCVVMVPAVYLMASHFGAVGAAAVWLMVNVLNLVITVPLTHRRLLRHDALKWLGEDVCMPLMGAAIVVLLARSFVPVPGNRMLATAGLLLLLAVAFLAASVSAPRIRTWSRDHLRMAIWSR